MAGEAVPQGLPWPDGALPSVTVLKPLHGEEPNLFANLATFCAQDYAGHVEVIFGVSDPADPAMAAVSKLREAFPQANLRLVVDARRRGQNGKVSNLMNMAEHARHDVIVLADSDMVVGRDYLNGVINALAGPNVGAVTCLYRGLALPNLWSRLAARWIDAHFLPNVVVGLALGLAKPCFGSTIALRRETLHRVGGFAAVKDQLADDYALGHAVRGLGLDVVVPKDIVLGHLCAASSGMALLRQELRWSRTIRAVDPLGFAGSIITHPLPLAVLAALTSCCTASSLIALAAAALCRLALQRQIAHFTGVVPENSAMGPVRDLLAFFVFITSFFPGSIDWRGHRFGLRADGTLASPDIAGS